MGLNKKQKKFIKKNYRKLGIDKLSSKLDISKEIIINFLGIKLKKLSAPKLSISNYLGQNKYFLIFVLALTTLLYSYSLFGQFVSADDIPTLNNPKILDPILAFKGLNLNTISLSLILKAFGQNPFIFHLRSTLLHLVSIFLVFILSYQLFDKKISHYSTIIFALHPVNVEAVAWISGSGYLLNSIFMLTVLIIYNLFKQTQTHKYLFYSFMFYALSFVLLQSPWLLVVVPITFILDYISEKKKYTFVYFLIPSFLFLAIYLPSMFNSRISDLSSLTPALSGQTSPYFQRVVFSIYSMTRLLIIPLTLSIFNEGNVISTTYFGWMILVDILYFVTIMYFYKKNVKLSGILFILIVTILPVFSPKIIAFFMAERYLYLGSVFFAMLASYFFIKLEEKFKYKNLSLYILISVLVLFSLKTIVQTFVWHNSSTLWIATQKVSPNNARVYNNLGDVYGQSGNLDKEIESFKKAIELDPNYADAIFNLGLTYFRIGRTEDGKNHIQKAIQIKPSLTEYGKVILDKYSI